MASGATTIQPDAAPASRDPAPVSVLTSHPPAASSPSRWGWFPALVLCCAAGLLLISLADAASRHAAPFADTLFWAGLVVVVAPVAWRLCLPGIAEAETVALVLAVGLALYLVKLLAYPTTFALYDEFLHWRTAMDIAASGHLFAPNSLLPISPLYPGLEIVTSSLSALTGLSLFQSGVLVLAAGRLLLTGSLYLFYRHIAGSVRLAGLASLYYMANPHDIFFESQFAYESLALPLGAFALYLLAHWSQSAPSSRERRALVALALAALGALTVTHHVTSFAVVAFLALWAAVSLLNSGAAHARRWLAPLAAGALVCAAGAVAWLLVTRGAVAGYILPHVTQALAELRSVTAGRAVQPPLFHDFGGQSTPAWETVAGVLAVVLATLTLPLGWRSLRCLPRRSAATCLALVALVYPLSQLFRLTPDGTELADRLPDFLYVAVAWMLALAIRELSRQSRGRPGNIAPATQRLVPLALAVTITLLFAGGLCIGAGPAWMRLPGPSLVEADPRSMDTRHVALGTWMRANLGPGHTVATDRDTRLVVETYGDQHALTVLADRVDTSSLFTNPRLDDATTALIRVARIRYIVVDQRLSQALPRVGVYFEQGEPGAYAHTTPLSGPALDKFDGAPAINRVYDDGQLVIYDTAPLLANG